MTSYTITKVAKQDLDDIVSYISQDNPVAAFDYLEKFFLEFDTLAENPMMGHSREALTNRPVRFWPLGRHYLIVYKDVPPIEIVRVLSGYRDLPNLLN